MLEVRSMSGLVMLSTWLTDWLFASVYAWFCMYVCLCVCVCARGCACLSACMYMYVCVGVVGRQTEYSSQYYFPHNNMHSRRWPASVCLLLDVASYARCVAVHVGRIRLQSCVTKWCLWQLPRRFWNPPKVEYSPQLMRIGFTMAAKSLCLYH